MQQVLGGPRASLATSLGVDAATALVLDTLSLRWGTSIRFGTDVFTPTGTEVDETDLPILPGGEFLWAYRPPFDPSKIRNEEAEVRRTASIVTKATSLAVETLRYRPWTELTARDGTTIRFNHGWMVSTNPPLVDDGTKMTRTLDLADKTFGYRRELPDVVAPGPGVVILDFVADRLATRFGETDVIFPASTMTLDEGLVFRPPTTELEMLNALLQMAGCDSLTTDEDLGRPRTVLLSELAGRSAEWTYGPGAGKIKVAGSVEPLLERTPNVVYFIARQGPTLAEEDNGIAIRRNQSTGPASIDARNGEEFAQRVEVDAEDQDVLDTIADAEKQRYFAGGGLRYVGEIGINPLHGDRDVVALNKPRFAAVGTSLAGDWIVTEWRVRRGRINQEGAALMDITLEKRV